MCGIAGFARFDGGRSSVSVESLVGMTRALRHRGPDDEGYALFSGAGLGSRRLSIIDTSPAGRMPIFNEDRTVAVVQNGEIYNFKTLRDALVRQGHHFSGGSDTEVLVHLYEEKGPRLFADLDGMYAIAIYDQRRRLLLLGRDRFGEKPLFYCAHPDGIGFASELKALVHCPLFDGTLDEAALDQYLMLSYIVAPHSIYRGTRKLLPGHTLLYAQETGVCTTTRYWTPPRLTEPVARNSEREYVEEFESLFSESVRSRLVSDVPVGAFLSGGIDSSLVVAAMVRSASGPLRTFSIGLGASAKQNENDIAQKVAERLGVHHTSLEMTFDDFARLVCRFPELCDEPLGDTALLGVHLITQHAKSQGISVMLSGDGGDELFLGYPILRWVRALGVAYSGPKSLRALLGSAATLGARTLGNSRLQKAAEAFRLDTLAESATYLSSHGAWSARELCVLKGARPHPFANERVGAFFADGGADPDAGGNDPVAAEYSVLLEAYLPDNNLARMDRASMAAGVETRSPFLHPRLLEFAARLPLSMKIRGRARKYLLRSALATFLPLELIDRPKHGFDAFPMAQWLRGELQPLLSDYLSTERLARDGRFDGRFVARTVKEHLRGGRYNHWWKLWLLVVLEMWLDERAFQMRLAAGAEDVRSAFERDAVQIEGRVAANGRNGALGA